MLTSEHFPPWYLGHHPGAFVVTATYGQELADDFGRSVRAQMLDPLYQQIFPECQIDPDSASVSRISTMQHGKYFAVGIGGPLTGRGANVLVIDDPHKDRQDADSVILRKRVKDWFQAVAYTRLMPGGAVVCMQCMTGDTPVMLPDGTERRLDAIRAGDIVATYDDGRLSSAKVLAWKSNGSDSVHKITMSSGRIVRANGRHPFLVSDNGELRWIRTQSLNTAHRIVGLRGIVRRLATRSLGMRQKSSIATASLPKSTRSSLLSRAGNALSAVAAHLLSIGGLGYASITVTSQERSGGYFATTAISPPGIWAASVTPSRWPNTSEFTADQVVSVEDDGEDEVFDVQIERTENFIANGLVSHNTRWHEDDLAGWLLRERADENWEVLSIPAEPTPWPEAFPADKLDTIRRMIGPRDWSALYMQAPTPGGGGEFKREWVRFYQSSALEVGGGANKYILIDPAGENRPGNDYTSIWVVGLGPDGNYYWLDGVRDRLNLTERGRAVMRLHRKWRPLDVRYERYGMMGDIQYLRDLQERENYRFVVTEVAGRVKKNDRIRRLLPMFEQGKFYAPVSMHYTDCEGVPRDLVQIFTEEEMAAFPAGLHDDMLDSLARIAEPDLPLIWPTQEVEEKRDRYSNDKYERASAWAA